MLMFEIEVRSDATIMKMSSWCEFSTLNLILSLTLHIKKYSIHPT